LRQGDGAQTTDWGQNRRWFPPIWRCAELLLIDSWNHPGFLANAFYTEPFKKFCSRKISPKSRPAGGGRPRTRFRVKAPLLAKGQTLCLLGEGAARRLEHRRARFAAPPAGRGLFLGAARFAPAGFSLAYKYGVFDVEKNIFVRFEGGANRRLKAGVGRDQHTVVNDGFAVLPADTWRGAGVAVPVSACGAKAVLASANLPT
jgi:4-alpha-glucanotransferase